MLQDVIFDVGMNNGDDTAYYLHRGYRVVAVEADPNVAKKAEERFSGAISSGKLTILNCAIAEQEGVLPFWVCLNNSEWSSFDRNLASKFDSECHSIEVQTHTFEQILEKYCVPFYLKIDIEGNDHLCIEALQEQDVPAYVSFEFGTESVARMPRLRDLSYTAFKALSQWNFLPLDRELDVELDQVERVWKLNSSVTQRSMKGKIVRMLGGRRYLKSEWDKVRRSDSWVFPLGASGPFGEETIGRWQTYDEILDSIDYFARLHKEGKPTPFWGKDAGELWVDIHCRHQSVVTNVADGDRG